MDYLPASKDTTGTSFTIGDFFEAGRERLRLKLLCGRRYLSRKIEEPILNRPGLVLAGFPDHFAAKRIQIVGNSEVAYLRSLPKEVILERLTMLANLKATVYVITNGESIVEQVIELAERHEVVIIQSELPTHIFSQQCTFILEQLGAPRTSIYGTMVEVCGLGVLFEGDPGLGKSETALGLIKRGHALISDDLTCIRKDNAHDLLFGSASESTAGYMEIRGIGIIHVPSVFGINAVRGEKRLQLVISFRRLRDVAGEIDRVGQTRKFRNILGVNIPQIVIPVSEGRDLVNLVETAAQQQKVIEAGIDPVNELSERLRRRADRNGISKTKSEGRTNHE